MHIAALVIYPVKGLRAVPLQAAAVLTQGLEHDRRWAVAGADGRVLTQRECPAMAGIDARIENGRLRLECVNHGGVEAHATDVPQMLDIWRTQVPVLAANTETSEWLSRVLGTSCTLVHQADPNSRPVTPDLAAPGDHVSLADGFPLLITTAASLDDLNRRLAAPVPMDRFRPNLVIDGAEPWAEDGWSGIATNTVTLRLASPCSRCKVITLDQRTGENPARTEPLKTLGTFHRDAEGRITFGWNAIPESLGLLRVGDAVTGRAR